MRLIIVAPAHCSCFFAGEGMGYIPFPEYYPAENDVDAGEAQRQMFLRVMSIQVPGEGVMWRTLFPMLFESSSSKQHDNNRILQQFAMVWFNHVRIHYWATMVSEEKPDLKESDPREKLLDSGGADTTINMESDEGFETQIYSGWYVTVVPKLTYRGRKKSRAINGIQRNKKYTAKSQHATLHQASMCKEAKAMKTIDSCIAYSRQTLVLRILPPLRLSRLGPELAWTGRLIGWENLRIKLQTLNAVVATLGGGYFLCRHLSTAVALARYQRGIALRLNDAHLALHCTVNEAYNYIHAGQFNAALLLIRTVMNQAKRNDDTLLYNVARAARVFAKRVRQANLREGTDSTGTVKRVEMEHGKDDNGTTRGSDILTSNHYTESGQSKSSNDSSFSTSLQPNNNTPNTTTTHKQEPLSSATFDDYQRIRIVHDQSNR
jgi:hypothetical protein